MDLDGRQLTAVVTGKHASLHVTYVLYANNETCTMKRKVPVCFCYFFLQILQHCTAVPSHELHTVEYTISVARGWGVAAAATQTH
jgi:hypothetical protein